MESELENNFVETTTPEIPKKNFADQNLVIEWKKEYLRSKHSFHSMTTYHNYIFRFVGKGIEINQKSINTFLNKSSSGAAIGAIKNFINFLVNKKEFPQEILLLHFDKTKSIKKFPKSISPLEVQKIIDAIPELKEKLFTKIIYFLGLRISEGLKLEWQDINFSKWLQDKSQCGDVNIINSKGGKFRTITIPQFLISEIYEAHKSRDLYGMPIPNPGSSNSLIFDFGIDNYLSNKEKSKEENKHNYIVYAENRYRELLYKISQETIGRKINPHQLRHTFAKDLMDHNVPIETIKSMLGHQNISSTEIYAQASSAKIHKDMEEYYKNAK